MPRLRSRVRDSFPAPFKTKLLVRQLFSLWRDSKVVMQRIANPSTPVRFRLPPPSITADTVFPGGVAECLCDRVCKPRTGRLKSAPPPPESCRFLLSSRDKARVVKLVDTTDLKSVAPDTGVPVRFRSRAPTNTLFNINKIRATLLFFLFSINGFCSTFPGLFYILHFPFPIPKNSIDIPLNFRNSR